MKRRNADTGKMRRPLKRTKIAEGMYGNSLLYLKFLMLWATVVLADYMLEFRFEFLWPFWMMLRSVYDSFKYQGLAFSVFFICIALTSDMLCFFLIPLQYIFFAASTYVWVQYVWYSFAEKGVCLHTVALCCLVVYVEGAVRGSRGEALCRPLAAHCVGYPAVTLCFSVRSQVAQRLRQRRQRRVRADNEFYFQLMRDALPEAALEQNQAQSKESPVCNGGVEASSTLTNSAHSTHMNGSLRRRCAKAENGVCTQTEHTTTQLHNKLDKLEKHISSTSGATRDKQASHTHLNGSAAGAHAANATHASNTSNTSHAANTSHASNTSQASHAANTSHASNTSNVVNSSHAANASHAHNDDEKHEAKGKSSKCDKKEASTLKEEKRKKNKDKDKDKENIDSHKNTENTREQVVREAEREREKEQREARECAEELRRVRAELSAAKAAEAEARRAMGVAAASERQRRTELTQLKQAHAAHHHKATALERRLADERRARAASEQQLTRARAAHDAELGSLRRDLARVRERAALLARELEAARAADAPQTHHALHERAAHLERSLSSETRVKLDLLSALGEAKRQLRLKEGELIRQDKELEELKAQMLAVMPTESLASINPVSTTISKLRLSDGSPLDPNASVYTPKQLCSDA